jgi:hypothetical protein
MKPAGVLGPEWIWAIVPWPTRWHRTPDVDPHQLWTRTLFQIGLDKLAASRNFTRWRVWPVGSRSAEIAATVREQDLDGRDGAAGIHSFELGIRHKPQHLPIP